MAFPGLLNKCEGCHVPGTYGSVPEGALMSTIVTTGDPNATIDPATSKVTSTDTTASLTALRNTGLANATDLVNTPFTAACVACHDSSAAKAHMDGQRRRDQQGAQHRYGGGTVRGLPWSGQVNGRDRGSQVTVRPRTPGTAILNPA